MADLNIKDLDYGFSHNGVTEYIESLQLHMLDNVKKSIEEGSQNVLSALDKGWSGASREKFDEKFTTQCGELQQQLEAQFNALKGRIVELAYNYAEQDNNMIID